MTNRQAERERVARAWWLETLEQLQQQRPPCATKYEEFKLLGEIVIKRTESLLAATEARVVNKAMKKFDSLFQCTDFRVDSVRDYRADQFYKWLGDHIVDANKKVKDRRP